MLSTTDPQVIPLISTAVGVLAGIIAGACAFYVARELKRVKSVQLDIAELFERLEALTARFTRFQKREGMREVREQKTAQKDLQDEAKAILAEAGVAPGAPGQSRGAPVASKQELYRRRH